MSVESNYNIDMIDWSGEVSEYNDQTDFTFLPFNNQVLLATAISEEGCEASDQLIISIDTDVSIYIPNIFSPNSDTVEDEFFISPVGRSLGEVSTFNIYDSWGGLIWEATEDNQTWSGDNGGGRPAVQGVYTYYLEAALINGEPIRSTGTVLLIR